jgi:hypothetical protein
VDFPNFTGQGIEGAAVWPPGREDHADTPIEASPASPGARLSMSRRLGVNPDCLAATIVVRCRWQGASSKSLKERRIVMRILVSAFLTLSLLVAVAHVAPAGAYDLGEFWDQQDKNLSN